MNRQQGVALISVLLIMSLALLLTSAMLRNHRLVIKSTAQQLHQMELRQLGFAAERWALQRLRSTDLQDARSVNLAQNWAHLTPPDFAENATLHIEIEDLAARFNLSLLSTRGKAESLTQARWLRLLALLQINTPSLEHLPNTGLEHLTDASQLRMLPGVSVQVLQRLLPMVAVLPKDASLNINTASAQQLMTLADLSQATAQTLVQQRPDEGYRSVQAFTEDPLISGREVGSHGLGLSSRWFRVTVQVSVGTQRLHLFSDVELEGKTRQVNVLQRRFATPQTNGSST